MKKQTEPIRRDEEIKQSRDPKIDQDFEGFPNGPARPDTVKPKTREEKETADLDNKDGEKRFYGKKETDEQDSDGSANAFDEK